MPRLDADRAGDAPPLWRRPWVRTWLVQLVVLAAVAALIKLIADNTIASLEARGIRSGFDFLWGRAGFDVNMKLIPYNEDSTIARVFVVGALNTLLLAALGIVLATLFGFLVGIARLSSNWLVARIATAYVEIFRNIPLLLQLFFWYFAVLRALPAPRASLELFDLFFFNNRGIYGPAPIIAPDMHGIVLVLALVAVAALVAIVRAVGIRSRARWHWALGGALVLTAALIAIGAQVSWSLPALRGFNFRGGIVLIPEFVALALALVMYYATYVADAVRAGILSVARGQVEAASSLGLRRRQTLRLVVVPQALRAILPPLITIHLNLFKSSTLAAAIAYPDIVSVFAGTVNNIVGQTVEIMTVTLVVYLLVSLAVAGLMNWYNRRVALVER